LNEINHVQWICNTVHSTECNSYAESVLAANKLGGDTNTIGALTRGGITGKCKEKALNMVFIGSILDNIV